VRRKEILQISRTTQATGRIDSESCVNYLSKQTRGWKLIRFIRDPPASILFLSGRNSMVECQLPKLDVAGSIPVARSKIQFANPTKLRTMKRGEVSVSAFRDDGQAINTDEMILIMRDERHAKM
jgi:hypothetical protein